VIYSAAGLNKPALHPHWSLSTGTLARWLMLPDTDVVVIDQPSLLAGVGIAAAGEGGHAP